MSARNEPRSKMGLPPHGLAGWMLACQIPWPASPLPPPALLLRWYQIFGRQEGSCPLCLMHVSLKSNLGWLLRWNFSGPHSADSFLRPEVIQHPERDGTQHPGLWAGGPRKGSRWPLAEVKAFFGASAQLDPPGLTVAPSVGSFFFSSLLNPGTFLLRLEGALQGLLELATEGCGFLPGQVGLGPWRS